jgi:L-threonylcarbamoyladenylate synthase
VIRVHPCTPDRRLVRQAADRIREGKLAVFPTRALYGIGADIGNPEAVERVFRVKRRPPDQPVSILIPSPTRISDFAADIPEPAGRLMEAFWPGRVTIVLPAAPSVSAALTGNTGKIGIRLPGHPVAKALLEALSRPITATSANLSGHPGCSDISDLAPEVMEGAAVILDAGRLAGGAGSTVVDAAASPPVILREGGVPAAEVWRLLGLGPG